jgi:integrase
MFSKAQVVVEGMAEHPNPCVGISKFREESRARYFDTAELHRLREALGDEPVWLGNLVKLYLASGLRKSELLSLDSPRSSLP